MVSIYQILVFLIPSVSMLSGLFVAPVSAILFLSIFFSNIKRLDFSRVKSFIWEAIFFLWLFISCIWSVAGLSAFIKFAIVLLVAISTIIFMDKRLYDDLDFKKIFHRPLVFGCIVAIILFFIEYRTEGVISRSFRNIFQESDRHFFVLYFLDRGCSVLSIISWPVILILFKSRYKIFAFFYIAIVMYVLKISDSLSSFIGFGLGLIASIVIYSSRTYLIYLLMLGVLAASIFMPTFSYIQNPREISHEYPTSPDSGKHRLFIWKFTAIKAMEKPLFGWGFDSSSQIPLDEENDIVYFNQYKWHPLPLHPHDCFMQIWLESGFVGLILYTMLLIKTLWVIKTIYKKNTDLLWASLASACFVNYLFIGMISYGVWQMWWISVASISLLLFKLFADRSEKIDQQFN